MRIFYFSFTRNFLKIQTFIFYKIFFLIDKSFSEDENFLLLNWEKGMMETYVYLNELQEADTQDERVKSILTRLEILYIYFSLVLLRILINCSMMN